ncbi:hypothetical protein NE237_000169 [Protea cynaroides]|uniref:Uncharacterized protein n=1 Tax=Protea cynaroides TaxID=273540 RepID=A0A9Q0JT04_9MAGN|nr:hypothetical protein NE237_000169 [Protea cynaroides]
MVWAPPSSSSSSSSITAPESCGTRWRSGGRDESSSWSLPSIDELMSSSSSARLYPRRCSCPPPPPSSSSSSSVVGVERNSYRECRFVTNMRVSVSKV